MSITPAVATALGAALFAHECGSRTEIAYRLSYAETGKSGGSYGRYQADTHANPSALHTLDLILQGAKMQPAQRGRILGILRNPAPSNPLSKADLAAVDAAIDSTQGRVLVGKQDAADLSDVLAELERCVAMAAEHGCTILPAALIGMGLWINQSGAPTDLLDWLRGCPVKLGGHFVPSLTQGSDIGEYLWLLYYSLIPFVREHLNEWTRGVEAIAIGCAALPPGTVTGQASAAQIAVFSTVGMPN